MAKRLFRIDIGIYGGELTIGQVSEGFVKHFIDKDENELIDICLIGHVAMQTKISLDLLQKNVSTMI